MMEPYAHKSYFNKRLKLLGRVIKWMVICFVIISVVAVTIYKFVPVKYPSSVVLHRIYHAIDGDTATVKHKWVPMEEISPYMKYAVICSEDYNYYEHKGVSLSYVKNAFLKNLEAGRIVAGGSTITQQTAKNVFLYPHRTFFRKIMDVWFAFIQELIWGKERIMEVYLNSIEYGRNIYGIECAANELYGISAKELSLEQCVHLSVMLVQPRKYNVHKLNYYTIWRIRECLGSMRKLNYISEYEYAQMLSKYGTKK